MKNLHVIKLVLWNSYLDVALIFIILDFPLNLGNSATSVSEYVSSLLMITIIEMFVYFYVRWNALIKFIIFLVWSKIDLSLMKYGNVNIMFGTCGTIVV